MDLDQMTSDLAAAEALLATGEAEKAAESLAALAADAEEYVDRNCPTTEEVQYFSFPTIYDRLAYRRVERDPRRLEDVGEPLDRLYGDLAYAYVHTGDYDRAREAMKQAVRWNPMDCAHRLDLAELYRVDGNLQEWLGLSYSVFQRASDPAHLVRAYVNFARYFGQSGQPKLAAACLKCAQRLEVADALLEQEVGAAKGTESDPDALTYEEAGQLVEGEGIPEGANAEIAVCLLMCATDAAAAGERKLATALTLQARDLVGEAACKALIALIREADGDAPGAPEKDGQ
ncbi:tetratricopeptide repeat protein [Olsenella sp. YH-ols2217]|uniref:Tetratricopeptide repeat protein n=1 Tax=Kribbibacterium absianum TaxID=3044210 RepID=A0ABT6ZK32_9ACTN|nr:MULTISPECIES: tetratricopeptide repeat protein [unclassified Olsenella]MDJ1122355.1 tetratricopeptide repeat protein [Olsenella sp. YH-ols2216]MDJ1129391.1 tetratricopeptide repeat protein [Olsenella sp. YH-ols2217]